MKRVIKHTSSIYKFLDSLNILEKGSPEEIVAARKQYWRVYKALWRKENRHKLVGFTPYFTKEEVVILNDAAKLHKRSKTQFVKVASLAYISKNYLVPDILQIRKVIQLLQMNFNIIQEMLDENKIPIQAGKILLDKLNCLELQIRQELHSPKTLEQLIVDAIKNDPSKNEEFIKLLKTLK